MSVGDFLHKSRHLRFGAYVLRHADDILSFMAAKRSIAAVFCANAMPSPSGISPFVIFFSMISSIPSVGRIPSEYLYPTP